MSVFFLFFRSVLYAIKCTCRFFASALTTAKFIRCQAFPPAYLCTSSITLRKFPPQIKAMSFSL